MTRRDNMISFMDALIYKIKMIHEDFLQDTHTLISVGADETVDLAAERVEENLVRAKKALEHYKDVELHYYAQEGEPRNIYSDD